MFDFGKDSNQFNLRKIFQKFKLTIDNLISSTASPSPTLTSSSNSLSSSNRENLLNTPDNKDKIVENVANGNSVVDFQDVNTQIGNSNNTNNINSDEETFCEMDYTNSNLHKTKLKSETDDVRSILNKNSETNSMIDESDYYIIELKSMVEKNNI